MLLGKLFQDGSTGKSVHFIGLNKDDLLHIRAGSPMFIDPAKSPFPVSEGTALCVFYGNDDLALATILKEKMTANLREKIRIEERHG